MKSLVDVVEALKNRLTRSGRRARRKLLSSQMQRAVMESLESRTYMSLVPAGYHVVQYLGVPMNGGVATSMSLQNGGTYVLMAWGTGTYLDVADAEYVWQGIHVYDRRADAPYTDYGISVTLDGSNPSQAASIKSPIWLTSIGGQHQVAENHVYFATVTGQGSPLKAIFNDDYYDDNSGMLQLAVLAPGNTPTPPAHGPIGGTQESDSNVGSGQGGSGGDPVNYFDGTLQFDHMDISSDATGTAWGQGRSWTNRADQVGNNTNGNG